MYFVCEVNLLMEFKSNKKFSVWFEVLVATRFYAAFIIVFSCLRYQGNTSFFLIAYLAYDLLPVFV